jgi:hypothetical protein
MRDAANAALLDRNGIPLKQVDENGHVLRTFGNVREMARIQRMESAFLQHRGLNGWRGR